MENVTKIEIHNTYLVLLFSLLDTKMSSAQTWYRAPYPSNMSKAEIDSEEALHSFAYIYNVPASLHTIPDWSFCHDPEGNSCTYPWDYYPWDEDDYIPSPSKKKKKKCVRASFAYHSSNRFAILAKLPDNATTLTKTPKRK